MSIPAHIEHVFKALERKTVEFEYSRDGKLTHVPEPQQPMPGSPALVEGSSPTAGPGTAGAGSLYPVTCRARYYDAASKILEDELHLFTHDNADELGHVIQKWIEETRDNWEPR